MGLSKSRRSGAVHSYLRARVPGCELARSVVQVATSAEELVRRSAPSALTVTCPAQDRLACATTHAGTALGTSGVIKSRLDQAVVGVLLAGVCAPRNQCVLTGEFPVGSRS